MDRALPALLLPLLLLSGAASAQAQLTNSGNLYFHAGATVAFYGNFANNGTFVDSATSVAFKGSAAQTISGSSATAFKALTVNSAVGISLQRSVSVNTLTLTAGALTLGNNTLTIQKSSSSAITRTGGYIVSERTDNGGKVTWNIGADTSTHRFPFGTAAGIYVPVTVRQTSGNMGNVTVSTYPTAFNNTPYPSSPVQVTSMNDAYGNDNSGYTVDRFWQIDKDGADGTATLTFTATAAEVGSLTTLRAQRWNSSAGPGWDAPLPGQTATSTSVTVPGVTSFSPWTMSGSSSPLPITLVYFSATVIENSYIDLKWKTMSETNNDLFVIEKTSDGVNFTLVAEVNGAGTSTHPIDYSTIDPSPYDGVSYYRLRQIDFNGQSSNSGYEAVEITRAVASGLSLAPNPAESDVRATVIGAEGQPVLLQVIDANGNEVYSEHIIPASDKAAVQISRNRLGAAGIYFVIVSGENIYSKEKLIVH
jgi:hypothetical protein